AVIAVTGVLILSLLFVFHKELVCVSMDRETAAASGLPVLWLDVMLYVTVAVAVVVSVQIIGNVLVLALLVGPAATARLLTDKLTVMMLLS
ncbi:iron chelate uptake ABC transporter family permease subunit, partial [Escherichia coli]|nr:iron chelate uptake ABC transporter family permease subunit [Escherichia coli]